MFSKPIVRSQREEIILPRSSPHYEASEKSPQLLDDSKCALAEMDRRAAEREDMQKESLILIITHSLFRDRRSRYHAKKIQSLPLDWHKSDCFYVNKEGEIMPIFLTRGQEIRRSWNRHLARYNQIVVLIAMLAGIGFVYLVLMKFLD